MDTSSIEHESSGSVRKTRSQRYQGFALEADDEDLLRQLPANQQEVLRAHGSYADMAAALNVPMGTLRSRLHRARAAIEKLRKDRAGHSEGPQQGEPKIHQ